MQHYFDKLKTFSFRGYTIPQRMHQQIAEYLAYGIEPCEFLVGIITKNLGHCVEHADDNNIPLIAAYYAFFFSHAPATAWGSEKWYTIQRTSFAKERAEYLISLQASEAVLDEELAEVVRERREGKAVAVSLAELPPLAVTEATENPQAPSPSLEAVFEKKVDDAGNESLSCSGAD